MSHVFELTDEQYAALEAYARKQGQNPEEAFLAWVAAMMRQPGSRAKQGSRLPAGAAKEPVAQPARAAVRPGEQGEWDERRGEIFANNDLDDFANDE
jgi:hypothetical protein